METFDTERINNIIEEQLAAWPEAKENYLRLHDTERKRLRIGEVTFAAQWNPGRIKSTGAKVDAATVASRACFLCAANRPKEQVAIKLMEGWELLVNPYPIFPVHFTIVSERHRPQDEIPIEMAAMAEAMPSLAIFFNGARAGASAPDHAHVQAVLKQELPLLHIAEELHPSSHAGFMTSREMEEASGKKLPFYFVSAVITPDLEGMKTLAHIPDLCGIDKNTHSADKGLINAFFWMGEDGLLRALVVPRGKHRPECYSTEPGTGMTVSPGAIDMAGIMILPRREDFDSIDADTAAHIYEEVGSEPLGLEQREKHDEGEEHEEREKHEEGADHEETEVEPKQNADEN